MRCGELMPSTGMRPSTASEICLSRRSTLTSHVGSPAVRAIVVEPTSSASQG